jgi:hypothetical protein
VEYTLTCGEFSARLNIIGIDSVPCGPESNVDFVHFVWDNIEQFSCTRHSISLLPLTKILPLVHRRSTSLITGERATVGVFRTVAQCEDPSTWRSFVPSPTIAYSPADPVNALSADANPPSSDFPPLVSCFVSNSTWNCLNCWLTLRTISICTPSGQIGLADDGSSLPIIPSSASRMVQTGPIVDVIATVLEVTGRGRGHVPTTSDLLSKRSLLWQTFGSSCGVNCLKPLFIPPDCSLHQQPVLPWMR